MKFDGILNVLNGQIVTVLTGDGKLTGTLSRHILDYGEDCWLVAGPGGMNRDMPYVLFDGERVQEISVQRDKIRIWV